MRTSQLNKDDYIDEDVAYLIGLITGKGKIIEEDENRRLIIEFPYRNLTPSVNKESGIDFKIPERIKLGIFDARRNLHELLGEDVIYEEVENSVQLIVKFSYNTMVWRNINTILMGKRNYYEFEINPVLFELPISLQKSFIRGFADSSSIPSEKDMDGRIKRHRIVLQFAHDNWKLPLQVCKLLQEHIGIPVIHIMYGHPSLNRGFREHRMRIYPEDFIKIGYGFDFKQEILKFFVRENMKIGTIKSKFCNPKLKRKPVKKERKPEEKDEKLPEFVRKHFNSYWQICKACGCKQGKKLTQAEIEFNDGSTDE